MTEVGARIGAIASSNKDEVRLFGYGVYEGDEVPPQDVVGPFGIMSRPNPKLKLDNGDVVWGCECWWGPEDKVKASIGSRKVVPITTQEYRAQVVKD
jgi:hypothetical protein